MDTETLETAGANYLMYKLPNWNPNDVFPTEEQINGLSGKARARVNYVVNLIKSLHENRNKGHNFDQLKYHNRNREFAVEDSFKPEQQVINLDQSSFQEELASQVEDKVDNNYELDDNSIEEDSIEIVNQQ